MTWGPSAFLLLLVGGLDGHASLHPLLVVSANLFKLLLRERDELHFACSACGRDKVESCIILLFRHPRPTFGQQERPLAEVHQPGAALLLEVRSQLAHGPRVPVELHLD